MTLGSLLRHPTTAMLILAGFLVLLAGRLTWIQGLQAPRYRSDVDRIVEKHVRVVAPRGRIFDSRGLVLADNRAIVNLVVDARELERIENRIAARALRGEIATSDPRYAAFHFAERVDLRTALIRDLAEALGTSLGAKRNDARSRMQDLTERLSRTHADSKTGVVKPSNYVPIAKVLSPEDEAAVRGVLRRHGVSAAFLFEEEFDRTYPAGASVSCVVGFYGYKDLPVKGTREQRAADAPGKSGTGGIEGSLDDRLRGIPGSSSRLRAPNVPGGLMDMGLDVSPVAGADVHLTIDGTLSAILRDEAEASFAQYPCDAVGAVLMEVETGRILAMASVPAFDPNARQGSRNFPLTNVTVGHSFEPGSSVKPFTVAAALEAGVIEPDDAFNVNYPSGFPVLKRAKPIRDSHVFAGSLDVRGILQRSSNIGAVKIGHRLGASALAAAFERFGFDSRAGLPLPGEGKVALPSRKRPWDVANDLTSVSFGYQFYVTPVRLAAAYAIIANGGMRVEPRLIDEIRHPDGRTEDVKSAPSRRVLSEAVAARVREMLTAVVQEEHGTAYRKALELRKQGFEEMTMLAGKTGTAVLHSNPSRMNGTFAVFGPMPNPRLVSVFVVFNSGARFGGDQVAGPALRAIARAMRALGLTEPAERFVKLDVNGIPPVVSAASYRADGGTDSKDSNDEPRRERRLP